MQEHRDEIDGVTMRSIGTVLAESLGIGKGFDTMRILLSVAILVVHSFALCYGWGLEAQLWAGPAGSVSVLLLPAFFALSGFLVTGSALRTGSLTTFISLRALRILPALFTEVVLAAVLIGAVATNLPVGEYYTDPGTVSYLVNIIGHITYTLPGAFADNPVPVVNGSLWTIAPEISCYIFMALMILANTYRSCLLCCTVFLVGSLAQIATGAPLPDRFFAGGLEQFELLLCFVAGNILFLARNRIPDHPLLFLLCATCSMATLSHPDLVVLGLLPLAYCTVWLGLRNLPKIPLVSKGDYSYGVYLYAYQSSSSWYWHCPTGASGGSMS